MKRYSNDLRIKVIKYLSAGGSKLGARKVFGLSRTTIYKWIKEKEEGKLQEAKQYHHGRKSIVDIEKLKLYMLENADRYYYEIAKDFGVSKSQIFRILKKLNYSHKKKTTVYREADELKKAEFKANIAKIKATSADKLFFVDESGLEQYIYRDSGKAIKGEKVHAKISGKKFVRTSVISALNSENKLLEPLLYNGTADTELVIHWVKNMLLPSLPPNSLIVWDNASIHKSQKLKDLLEQSGHSMIFLPPYSPDLNPIEHKWHELKMKIRRYYNEYEDFIANLINQINAMSSHYGN